MRAPRKLSWSLGVVLALILPAIARAQTVTISGMIRDSKGNALGAAKVLLSETSLSTSPLSLQATSDAEGKYKFERVHTGDYTITAQCIGFATSVPAKVTVAPASDLGTVDITLTESGSPPTRAPLKLQAAGVRGLIDPGGYSAPANAAAASGLIKGVADIKRVGNNIGGAAATEFPCNMEPALQKAAEGAPPSADANRALGRFYLAHDQGAKAVPFLERAHQLDDANYGGSRDLAIAWIKTGQFDSARELLTVLATRQNQPEIHRLLARALEGSETFKQASQEYQIAAAQDPSEENLFGVGYELILAGLPVDAGRAFQAGVKQHPRSITLLIGDGTAKFLQGQASESVLSFLRASDVDPADLRPYSFLASASGISQEENQKVKESFKRFLEVAPASAPAHYYYALSLWRERGQGTTVDVNQIESLLKQAISLDPNLAKAHFQLAVLYAERGDNAGAAREFETALRLAPTLTDARYRLAMAYKRFGKDDLAERELQLFRAALESTTRPTSEGGIDIAQFISVIEPPKDTLSATAECPSVSTDR